MSGSAMRDFSTLKALLDERFPDRSLRGVLHTFPATLTLTAILTTTSLTTRHLSEAAYQRLLEQIGMSYAEVWSRDAWHMLTVTFIQSNPGIGVGMVTLLLSGLALAELQIGTWRTVVTFFTCDWLTSITTSLILRGMMHLGVSPATDGFFHYDAGSSAAGLATLAVGLVMLFPNRLARIALAVLLLWNVASLEVLDFGIGMVHIVAVLVGALYAEGIWKRRLDAPAPTPAIPLGHLTDAHA
jgi:hypothetical protein